MPDLVIAARDAPAADRAAADLVCTGKDDVAVLAKAFSVPDREVELTAGTFDGNAGFTAAGNHYLRPAEGVTVRGVGPGLTRIVAEREPCRIAVDTPGVTLANFGGFGYVGIQDTADRFTCEDVYVTHAIGGEYVPFGQKGGCTAAFMVWGRRDRTVRNLTFRRCTGHRTYHHAFSPNLAGAQEGGGFADILFDQCSALAAGSGMERWSCGYDIPDAGDIARMTVRDSEAVDCYQDGFHLDGSWDGHRQRAEEVLFERCRASWNGWRSATKPAELYQSGFYVQSARLVDCTADNNRKAGFLCKNQTGGLVLERCRDTGSAYGLVIEYGGNRAQVIGFVSDGATRRALQMVGSGAEVEVEIRNFAGDGRPVLLSITERLEFVDTPSNVEDLKRYRARGYAMKNNRIRIVTDRPIAAPEVHPSWVNSVEMEGVAVDQEDGAVGYAPAHTLEPEEGGSGAVDIASPPALHALTGASG